MPSQLRRYRITAVLLCHDVRLNTHIHIEATLDHAPSEAEAHDLLWPEGEREVARNFCEDCPFHLYGIEISLLEE